MSSVENADHLLTITEVMNKLKVGRLTVYDYIYSGKLRAHRLGGTGGKHKENRKPYRIWETDLLEFIDSGKFSLLNESKRKKST